MLLDKYMPEYHFNETHSVKIKANAEQVMKAVKELGTNEISSILSFLLFLRSIPILIKRREKKSVETSRPFLDEMYKNKFFLLEENKNELVISLVGKFWQLSNTEEITIESKEHFLGFIESEYGMVCCNLLFTRGRLSTETRIFVGNKDSRKKFMFYWFVIRLGSGLIRRVWLRAIKRKAIKINNTIKEESYAKNIS